MAFRRHEIAYMEALSDRQTWEYDLGERGVLSWIGLSIYNTNGGTSNLANQIYRCIERIEVVDGSDKLHSTIGAQNQGSIYKKTTKTPTCYLNENADAVQEGQFAIWFGRYIGDHEFGLDLSMLNNPKLEVTVNFEAVRACGATGYLSGYGDLSCILIKDDEKTIPKPAKFLSLTEQYDWTTAASGSVRIDMPDQWPYTLVGLRSKEDGIKIWSALTRAKLSLNDDEFVAFDEHTDITGDFEEPDEELRAQTEEYIYAKNDDTYQTTVGIVHDAAAHSWTDGHNALVNGIAGNQVTISLYDTATPSAVASEEQISLIVKGLCYQDMLWWHWDPLDPLEVHDYRKSDLTVWQGNAGGAASVVVEEVRDNVQK